MRITLYGGLADAAGREVTLAVGPGATVADVRRDLIALHPAAAASLSRPTVRACLDGAIVGEEQPLPPDCELSFFPPLSGG